MPRWLMLGPALTVRLLLASLLGAFVVVVASLATAHAACPPDPEVPVRTGNTITYVCTTGGGGGEDGGGSTGGGGGSGPSCTLEAPYDELCIGTAACWMNNPAVVQDPSELEDVPKPKPDSVVAYVSCKRADGSLYDKWYWNDDLPVITLEERIRSAVGALDLPTIQASFNPPTRTLVNLPTWWWAENAPPGEITGTEALGVIAIAAPRSLVVDPGDGTATVSCPMSVTTSDTCTYAYRRAGDYTATVSIVYDLRFEFGGQELPVADIPADLRTITVDDDVAVPVREVQTRVTTVR